MITARHGGARPERAMGAEGFDPRYYGFFTAFNEGRHFEAHDVLEPLWLGERRRPNGDFYQGLIQLAGAFVHVRKGRQPPALALLELASRRLESYPDWHEGLDLVRLRRRIAEWRNRVGRGLDAGWLEAEDRPRLRGPVCGGALGEHWD
jgi:predicted metal-dependent hydrolase